MDVSEPGRALQDLYRVHCFGCGVHNEKGLQIKSRWEGDEVVCRWRPDPAHIGHPGYVYGGIIASTVDCHAIWTAMATLCREVGHDLKAGPPPFAFVTAKLLVNYLKPALIDEELELRAHVSDRGDRRVLVECEVLQRGLRCATAEVVTVRIAPPV